MTGGVIGERAPEPAEGELEVGIATTDLARIVANLALNAGDAITARRSPSCYRSWRDRSGPAVIRLAR